jgi:hypothetical protein
MNMRHQVREFPAQLSDLHSPQLKASFRESVFKLLLLLDLSLGYLVDLELFTASDVLICLSFAAIACSMT